MNCMKMILLVGIVGLMPACGSGEGTTVVVVLFDLSGSTRAEELRQRYIEQFKVIVDGMKPGDRIVADAITESPLATSTFPINDELPPFNELTGNKLLYDDTVKRTRAEILEKVKPLLFDLARKVPNTKIMEALQLAERVFKTYQRGRKALVIFSDMVEESEFYDFTREALSESRTSSIIAQSRERSMLPELAGVKVYVVGASAGTYAQMHAGRASAIRDFWLTYFSACGADLTKERYGGALLGWGE